MYGDETGGLVVSIGSYTSMFGYVGEDSPRLYDVSKSLKNINKNSKDEISNSNASKNGNGYESGLKRLRYSPYDTEVHDVIASYSESTGCLFNWDIVESLWNYGIVDTLRIEPNDHPFMICTPDYVRFSNKERNNYAELVVEKFNVPAFFFTPSSVLNAFSMGKHSALVIDVGYSGTSVVPVIDGYSLKSSSTYTDQYSGKILDKKFEEFLMRSLIKENSGDEANKMTTAMDIDQSPTLNPPCFYPHGVKLSDNEIAKIHPSYQKWNKEFYLDDVKKSFCKVWAGNPLCIPGLVEAAEDIVNDEVFDKELTLPDGNKITFNPIDRYRTAEYFFEQSNKITESSENEFGGIVKLTLEALLSTPLDSRKQLALDMCLTGGSSLLNGFDKRLAKDVERLLPKSLKGKVHPTHYKQFSPFVGGSILASLGSFQQMWISKEEYHEHGGPRVVEDRCVY